LFFASFLSPAENKIFLSFANEYKSRFLSSENVYENFLNPADEYKIYQKGVYVCSNYAEKLFRKSREDLDNRYFYFSCEVIKGNNPIGLSELYRLSDDHNHLLASDFLANYLRSNGALDNSWRVSQRIDSVIKYRFATLEIINSNKSYPEPYKQIEQNKQIELDSAYKLSHLYLLRYKLGFIGNNREILFNSQMYEGDKDLETYPMYNTKLQDSLDNIVKYAGECANLPEKLHFNEDRYFATIKACDLMRALALNIIPLENKRKDLLSNCQDFSQRDGKSYYTQQEILDQSDCNESLNKGNFNQYHEYHEKIIELLSAYKKEYIVLLGEFL
ncbi:MAG: hypothetical protein OXC37_05460, partial [Bdellovibrionaceae bacterium]|nr:hypothetical protein [Pseudobdellovibrionaceae bacterium]